MRQSLSLWAKGLIVIALVVGLVACGDDDDSSIISPPTTPTPESGS